jgi:hypothetical protein
MEKHDLLYWCVGLAVFTTVDVNSSVLWDVAPHSLFGSQRLFNTGDGVNVFRNVG